MKAKYNYEPSKRMWHRHTSSCHGAVLEQKMLFQGKLTKPGFKITTSTTAPIKQTIKREWYQLWKPKYWQITIGHETNTSYKDVQFRYYCTECDKQDGGVWDFIHEDSSPKLNPNKSRAA